MKKVAEMAAFALTGLLTRAIFKPVVFGSTWVPLI
jgi:hypothetical protein